MRLFLINFFPSYVFVIISIAVCLSFAFGFYYLAQKYLKKIKLTHTGIIYTTFPIFATFTGILLAFTIIVLWQTLLAAQNSVQEERDALAQIVIYSEVLPKEEQRVIRQSIKNYTYLLIQEEWPMMQQGTYSMAAYYAIHNIIHAIARYEPKTQKEQIFYQMIVSLYGKAYDARRDRLHDVQSIIPPAFFAILMISLFLLIMIVCIINNENDTQKIEHKINIFLTCVIVGLSIPLVIDLDYPFAGDISVSSHPFTEGVLGTLLSTSP